MGARRRPSGIPTPRERVGSVVPTRLALLLATAGALASAFASAQTVSTPAPGGAAGALSPEASGAFARAAAKYSDGSAHACPFVQIYTPAGFTTAKRESGTLWIQAPQRLRFDYEAPEKKTFTYDAGEGRLFTPEDKQLTIQKLTPEDRARLPIVFLSDPVELAREYAISSDAGDAGVTRLLLKPRSPRPELAWLRVSVARDGSAPELSYEDASGNRTEFRFDGWRKEKPRPAGDYRVTGPPGTRILQN
ncbi:MAG: outer membrane lipoprotein carrier protein LolA [Acidobacteriota bacterium]|nr:outer membrane lipoprotein carrier protein LolA [Acidobacteriota bacterium]